MATEMKIVVEPGEGQSLWLGGLGVDFKVPAEATGGAFSIVELPSRMMPKVRSIGAYSLLR